MSRLVGLSALALATILLLAGCGAASPSIGEACPAALMTGTLVADGDTLVIRDTSGNLRTVDWAADQFEVRPGSPTQVLDESGRVLAEAGDTVEVGGGQLGGPDTWYACGSVVVVPDA